MKRLSRQHGLDRFWSLSVLVYLQSQKWLLRVYVLEGCCCRTFCFFLFFFSRCTCMFGDQTKHYINSTSHMKIKDVVIWPEDLSSKNENRWEFWDCFPYFSTKHMLWVHESFEAPRWGASFEYPQVFFMKFIYLWTFGENRYKVITKHSSLTSPLIWGCF